MRLMVAICLFCRAVAAAPEDWRVALKQVRHNVLESISRSDNYICMEDVTRLYYQAKNRLQACDAPDGPPQIPLMAEDRVKMDVAVSNGAEIFAWHGEHKFSGGTVAQLVRQGPITSGSFNGYLRNIFAEPGIKFINRGMSEAGGDKLYDMDYVVPLPASHYQLEAGKGMLLVPFHGSLRVRASDYQLYSMTVIADIEDTKKISDICAVGTKLTYQLVSIAKHESLLPALFEIRMGSRDLQFTESSGKYSECRAYSGESTVHFDDLSAAAASATPVLADPQPLRPGLLLDIALRSVIEEDSAYAGEPVEGVLLRDVKVQKGRVLKRGATVRGTLTGFQIYKLTPRHVTLNLVFTSVVDGPDLYECRVVRGVTANAPARMTMKQGEKDLEDGTMLFFNEHLRLDHTFQGLFRTVEDAP